VINILNPQKHLEQMHEEFIEYMVKNKLVVKVGFITFIFFEKLEETIEGGLNDTRKIIINEFLKQISSIRKNIVGVVYTNMGYKMNY